MNRTRFSISDLVSLLLERLLKMKRRSCCIAASRCKFLNFTNLQCHSTRPTQSTPRFRD